MERAASLQSRIADVSTCFAGSMAFVYVHLAWFAWILLPVEKYPFGLLTMIVSLEAIFLATFVVTISQNRADARRQVFADSQYEMIHEEKKRTWS